LLPADTGHVYREVDFIGSLPDLQYLVAILIAVFTTAMEGPLFSRVFYWQV
jgi:hypothetical protein